MNSDKDMGIRVNKAVPGFLTKIKRYRCFHCGHNIESATRPKACPKCSKVSHEDDKGITMRRLGKKIGRNEKCPCGSDKKFKRCCINA